MSTFQKQREIVRKKEAKLRDYKSKVDMQRNTVNIRVADIQALGIQKENRKPFSASFFLFSIQSSRSTKIAIPRQTYNIP